MTPIKPKICSKVGFYTPVFFVRICFVVLHPKQNVNVWLKTFFDLESLKIFQSTLDNIEKQANLDESRLDQEKKECIQMNLNHKKHRAMTAFVDAVREHADEPAKIAKTFQRFMTVLKHDQDQK